MSKTDVPREMNRNETGIRRARVRILLRALMTAALLTVCMAGAALATETGLVLSGVLSPSELVVPGETTLTLTLQNTSDETISNVRIFMQTGNSADEIVRYEAIAAGEIVETAQVIRVSQTQLDNGEVVVFINSGYDNESVTGSGNIGIPIQKVQANVDLEFSRQLSSWFAVDGGNITIAYMVRNLGNVVLRQVTVRDELGDFEARVASLAPGESKTFLNQTEIRENTQSQASVSYTPQTETTARTEELKDIPIYLAREGLQVELETSAYDVYYGGQVELTARVTNTGSVVLTDISLSDSGLGMFTDKPFSLQPGEEIEVSRLATLFARRQFQLTASASSPTGNRVTAQSNALNVAVESDSGAVFLSIDVQAEMERIRRAGYVNFEIRLINSGFGSVSNVEIGERSLGALHTFTVVSAGEPTVKLISLPVEETTSFEFYYAVADDSGRRSLVYAAPVTVTLAGDGEEPLPLNEPTEPPILAGESTRPDSFNVYPYMITGALILLAALTTLLAVTSYQERRARRMRKKQREEAKKK